MGDEVAQVRRADARRDPRDARPLHPVAARGLDDLEDRVRVRPEPRLELREGGLGGGEQRGGRRARPVVDPDGRAAHGGALRAVVRIAVVMSRTFTAVNPWVSRSAGDRRPPAGARDDDGHVGHVRHADRRADRRHERVAVVGAVERGAARDPRDPAVEVRDPARPREQPARAGRRGPQRRREADDDERVASSGRTPPSGTSSVWSSTVGLTATPSTVVGPRRRPPSRAITVLSSSRSMPAPDRFWTVISARPLIVRAAIPSRTWTRRSRGRSCSCGARCRARWRSRRA